MTQRSLLDDFRPRPGAALVAGATGGIGAAIASMLAERGSRVVLGYHRNVTAAEQLAAAIGEDALSVAVDLSDATSAERLVATAHERFGGIHSVVYAAGPHVPMTYLSQVSAAQFAAQLTVDAAGFFHLVAPAIEPLRASGGSLVAVTTAATRRFPVRDGLSAAPKGSVEAVVRALAAEEGRYGVRYNSVGPGMLTDGMAGRLIASGELDDRALAASRENTPLRRFGTAADVAEAVCFLLSDRAGFITGQHLCVDGGYTV